MQTAWLSLTFASAALAAGPAPERLQAALALEAQDERAALAAFDALVRSSPAWELARLENARLRLKRGEGLALAEAHLEAALVFAPENSKAHFLWGSLMEERQRPEEAIAAYQRALVLRPDYDDARFRLGGLHFAQAQFAAAADDYRSYLQAHPAAVGARLQLAAAAERSGGTQEAEQELKKLFDAPASRSVGGRRLAELYERTGRRAAAAKIRATIDPPVRKLRELKRSGR